MSEHAPRRPDWSCLVDGLPWPCSDAREAMLLRFHPVELGIYMTSELLEASRDLSGAEPRDLWERFIAWTPDTTAPRASRRP